MENYVEVAVEENPRARKKKKPPPGYQFEGENGFAEFGGYMDAKISKLNQQYQAAKGPAVLDSNLFAGISIFVNGLTTPSSGELKLIMLRHGGDFHTYQTSSTNFIIASNLPDVKIRNHSVGKLIVRPEWIIQCLKEKRVVDFKPYLLVTERNHQQPKITFRETKFPSDIGQTVENSENNPPNGNSLSTGQSKLNDSIAESVPNIPADELSTICAPSSSAVSSSSSTAHQAMTANDPNFLSEFYNNSRLHHISTLGTMFKQHISDLRANHTGEFPGREELLKAITSRVDYAKESSTSSFIMHIDMDCFFVSVGLRSHPQLRGQPVAVTHSKGNPVKVRPGSDLNYEQKAFPERFGNKFGNGSGQLVTADRTQSLSEIASCSYEARAKGVKNGMFMGTALKLCPNLKTIPYDFNGYKEVALTLYNTIASYTLDIEAVSCDEMYVDLSSLLRTTQIPLMDFITYVRDEIKIKTGCPCSAGIGANRIQARMATKQAKPNGQFFLAPEDVRSYFQDILITDLPGVGRSTTGKLERRQWKTCGDLQKVPISVLQTEFGKKFGETLHQLSLGHDDKPLNYGQVRKSVSAEVNYGIRFKEQTELEKFLVQLCVEVQNRLDEARRKGKCVTLKYMVRAADAPVETAKFMGHGVCDVMNKSQNLNEFTADLEVIKRTVLQLNNELNIAPEELRGIGIQITKLDGGENEDQGHAKNTRLKEMFSRVQEKNKGMTRESKPIPIEDPPTSINNETVDCPPAKKPRGRPKKYPPKSTTLTKDITELIKPVDKNEEIDENVLSELPEEFREEAVRTFRMMTRLSKKTNKKDALPEPKKTDPPKTVDEEFLNALPEDIRREVEQEIKQAVGPDTAKPPEMISQFVSMENIFVKPNWKDLLLAWITHSDEPDEYDIHVTVGFWKELISDRRMEEVYAQLRHFYRIINSCAKCTWHQKYTGILQEIQQHMLTIFRRKIAIYDKIDCNKCQFE